MAINVNLLPPEYTSIKGLAKFLKGVRALGVISIAFFLIFTLGISAFYLISSLSLRNSNSQIDSLKGQIASQEKSETQIVLLKDRLSKIKTVQGTVGSKENIRLVSPYINSLSGSTSLTEASIDSQKAELSLIFRTNTDLSAFLDKISGAKDFGSIVLTSFTFNPSVGYTLGLRASKK